MTTQEFRALPNGIKDIITCEADTIELTDDAARDFCHAASVSFRPAYRLIGRKQNAPYLLQRIDGTALGRDWMCVYDPIIARSLDCQDEAAR